MKERTIKPVLLASDINVYSMARAFHEEYGVKSLVVAKGTSMEIENSKILDFELCENMDDKEQFLSKLDEIYNREENKEIQLILIGCADHYVRLIIENKEYLESKYVLPYTTLDKLNQIVLKENFYDLCEQHNIDYPKTFLYKKNDSIDFELDFSFPLILKPSDSVLYWQSSFVGQHKVYIINSMKELKDHIKKIYDFGYQGNLIIQELIPGEDSKMYDLHIFIGKDHKVKYMNLGNVLLEEHTPKGIGSNAATLTVYDENITYKIKDMLESIGYEGWVDCDLKLDPRDGKLKMFEINIRQGRSHYRNTGSGYNVAKYIVESYVLNKDIPFVIASEPYFWHVIPKRLVYKYVDQDTKNVLKDLVKKKRHSHSLFYKKDISFKRFILMTLKNLNHYRKFKRYYPRKKAK